MGSTNVRQHQHLRVPNGWTGQDKALIIQLEQLFDELYNLSSKLSGAMVTNVAYDTTTHQLTMTLGGREQDIVPVATLDDNGKIPANLLPAYVDDVEEYADLAHFPATGESDKIYVAMDTGFTYRWSGTQYVRLNTYDPATQSSSGLMSAADKTKLDGVAPGATANVGTITGIKMNGASKGTSGVVDLGTVITAHQDISGKVDGPSSATANAVAIFDGTGGKKVKNSGYTIGKSVPSDAVFTDTTYTAGSNITLSGTQFSLTQANVTGALGFTPADDSGVVHLAGSETITGAKTYSGNQAFTGAVNIRQGSTASKDISFYQNGSSRAGLLRFNTGNATNQTVNRFQFYQWSPKSTADSGNTGYYETYHLPSPTVGLTESPASYPIYTKKNLVSETASSGGTAVSLCTTGEKYTWNNKVSKAGDTMTGNLVVQKASGDICVFSKNTTTGLIVDLRMGSGLSNHGVYSNGYYGNSTFTSSAKWMIYRDSSGNVIVNGKSTDNVLKSGDTMTGTLHTTGAGFRRKNTTADITKSDNDLSANVDTYVTTYEDKNEQTCAAFGSTVYTSGQNGAYITAQNKKSDSTIVNNTIAAYIDKDGTMSYGVSNQSAFRSAIGVVNRTAASGGTSLSLVTTGDKYNWNQKDDLVKTTIVAGAVANLIGTYGVIFCNGCIWMVYGATITKLCGSNTNVIVQKYPSSGTQTGYRIMNNATSSVTALSIIK